MNKYEICLEKPAHFSWKECLWFLDRGYDDCLFTIDGASITRLFATEEGNLLIRITERKEKLVIASLGAPFAERNANHVASYVKDWFDLDRALDPFYALLEADEKLRFLRHEYAGLRLIGIPDLYEALCWSIIGQQINLPFAYRLKRRMVENFGAAVVYEGHAYHAFPSPAVLAQVTITGLVPLQFSVRKAEYLIGLAKLFVTNRISRQQLLAFADHEQMVQDLMRIRGVGLWTANYALMKSLKIMNSIPYGDAGLNKALFNILHFPKAPGRERVDEYFNAYQDWKAYLVFYLWRTLSHPRPVGAQKN